MECRGLGKEGLARWNRVCDSSGVSGRQMTSDARDGEFLARRYDFEVRAIDGSVSNLWPSIAHFVAVL
jgi:hypothetical protein